MKTISRTLTIILIGISVAGALCLILENTSLISNGTDLPDLGEGAMLEGYNLLAERPEGEHHHDEAASLSRGLSHVLIALAKIGGITVVVLLLKSIITHLKMRRIIKPVAR